MYERIISSFCGDFSFDLEVDKYNGYLYNFIPTTHHTLIMMPGVQIYLRISSLTPTVNMLEERYGEIFVCSATFYFIVQKQNVPHYNKIESVFIRKYPIKEFQKKLHWRRHSSV